MGQLAWLPTESTAAVGCTLGPVQPYLYKHVCRTQRVIISAEVCMDKEELKEEQEQGGYRSGAPAAQSWVNWELTSLELVVSPLL